MKKRINIEIKTNKRGECSIVVDFVKGYAQEEKGILLNDMTFNLLMIDKTLEEYERNKKKKENKRTQDREESLAHSGN